MRIAQLLGILVIALAIVTARAEQAAASTITVGGIVFDDTAFADGVLSTNLPGGVGLGGGAADLEEAVTGANVDTFADTKGNTPNQHIEVEFTDNLVINQPGVDLAVFDLFFEVADEFSLSLTVGGTSVVASISDTGIVNSGNEEITVAFFDLSGLGVAPGASVSSIVINTSKSVEFAVVGSLNGALIPEASLVLLLASGLLGVGLGVRRR